MVEFYKKDTELETHAEYTAAALALPPPDPSEAIRTVHGRLPGPHSAILRVLKPHSLDI